MWALLIMLNSYGAAGDSVVICKIDPSDVVSVPLDSEHQKLRCCKYEVVALFTDPFDKSVFLGDTPAKTGQYDEAWKDNIRERISVFSKLMSRETVVG